MNVHESSGGFRQREDLNVRKNFEGGTDLNVHESFEGF